MVEKSKRIPSRWKVAYVTFDECWDMAIRLSSRDDAIMASGAECWSIGEIILDVTRLAIDKSMGMGKWKSRLNVIKIRLRLSVESERAQERHPHRQNRSPVPHHASLNADPALSNGLVLPLKGELIVVYMECRGFAPFCGQH